jgi:hypothetical protein
MLNELPMAAKKKCVFVGAKLSVSLKSHQLTFIITRDYRR